MKINNLINIIKKKISDKIICEELNVKDKTFLHVKHKNFDKKKFHIKIEIKSKQLKIEAQLKMEARYPGAKVNMVGSR